MIISNAFGYEVLAIILGEELLSKAADRYRKCHPILVRYVSFAILGHLAAVLPPAIDIFSDKNMIHAFICRHIPIWRKFINKVVGATQNE